MKTVSFGDFMNMYCEQDDLRLGQMFHLMFIKDEGHSEELNELFNASDVRSIAIITNWLTDCQISMCAIPVIKEL